MSKKAKGKKVLTIRVRKKHMPQLLAHIPGATAQEILLRVVELGFEVLRAKKKAAESN